jgi:hypothetical protein
MPVVDYYRTQGKVVEVSGPGPSESLPAISRDLKRVEIDLAPDFRLTPPHLSR